MKGRALGSVVIFLTVFLTSHLFAQDVVRFSIPLPLTGTMQVRRNEKNSYEIALEEINAKGGIKRKKVAFEFEDSQGNLR